MFKSKAAKASTPAGKQPEKAQRFTLSNEIINNIASQSPSAMAQLAGTCQTLYHRYQPDLHARQLMEYVLKPTQENVKKAKAMVATHPRIMFIETRGVEWASGVEENREVPRIVKSTPFKAALGTGDKELYNYMAEYFDKVVYKDENGEVIETGIQRAQKQIQEQFPNGFDYPPVEPEFKELMTEIVTAITNDQMLRTSNTPSPATQALLKEFRHYFLKKDATQGHHFNLNYLIEALNVYNENYHPWKGNQLSLFWCQVIGYLERLVPAVDAQAFCQGLYSVLEEKKTLTRSLTLYNYQSSSNIDYFSSTPNSTATGLGFDFGIYIVLDCAWGGGASWRSGADASAPRGRILKNYVEQKHRSLTTFNNTLYSGLSRAPENPSTRSTRSTRCAIL